MKLFGTAPNKRVAAIAQSVERILGKDEVASSNLASSSNPNRKVRVLLYPSGSEQPLTSMPNPRFSSESWGSILFCIRSCVR